MKFFSLNYLLEIKFILLHFFLILYITLTSLYKSQLDSLSCKIENPSGYSSGNLEQIVDKLDHITFNDNFKVIDIINTSYQEYANYDISSLVTYSHLEASLAISEKNLNVSSILLFYLNLTYNLTSHAISFFTSDAFFSFIQNILLNYSDETILEYTLLIFTNLVLYSQSLCKKLLQNNALPLISNVQSDFLLVIRRKSYLLSIFLQYDLNDMTPIELQILKENLEILNSKFDYIKCYAVNGFIKALRWSTILFDFIISNNILIHLCEMLKNCISKKLRRKILTFILNVIQKDDNYLIQLIHCDFLKIIQDIVEIYEDQSSSLILDIYQNIIQSNVYHNLKLDFAFLLCFKNKGFIAKKRLIGFIFWMLQKNIKFLNDFNESQKKDVIYIVDNVADSEDIEACLVIVDLYIFIENSEIGKFLFSLLSSNEGFIHFLFENRNMSPNILYVESQINSINNLN